MVCLLGRVKYKGKARYSLASTIQPGLYWSQNTLEFFFLRPELTYHSNCSCGVKLVKGFAPLAFL